MEGTYINCGATYEITKFKIYTRQSKRFLQLATSYILLTINNNKGFTLYVCMKSNTRAILNLVAFNYVNCHTSQMD